MPIIIAQTRVDGAVRVLNGGTVAQLHGTLVLRKLPLGAVSHHLDALPHLARTGRGQRAAIHHELAAGTDDDASIVGAMDSIGDGEDGA